MVAKHNQQQQNQQKVDTSDDKKSSLSRPNAKLLKTSNDNKKSHQNANSNDSGPLGELMRFGGADLELVDFIKRADDNLRDIQREMREIDRSFHKKMRELESQKFSAKKSHFETRKKIISNDHKDFWQKMFLYNPEIEMHLNIDSKSEDVETCDIDIINSLRSVEVEVSNSDTHYETKMTIHLDPKNRFVENSHLSRTIRIPLDHLPSEDFHGEGQDPQKKLDTSSDSKNKSVNSVDNENDGIVVETTPIKPKKDLIELNAKLEKENVNFGLAPFIMQFVNKDYPIMNQFVESMKQVYSNPIYSLKSGLEEESNYQLAMSSEEFDDEDEDNELSEVNEEAEQNDDADEGDDQK